MMGRAVVAAAVEATGAEVEVANGGASYCRRNLSPVASLLMESKDRRALCSRKASGVSPL